MRMNLHVGKGRRFFQRQTPSGLAAVVCAAVFFLFAIPGQAQPARQVLNKHVRSAVASGRAAQVGFLPPTQRLQLAIMLPLRNQAELASLLGRLYDASSPDYRHFLSVDQFTRAFGPTKQDYQAVVNFAKANGFTVTDTPPNRMLVDINGTVAQIEKTFHVVMSVYRHPTENRTFFSPDREPSLDLSVPVSHIAGLNSFSIPRPALKRAAVGKAIYGNAGSGPGGNYLGSDMRAAYYGSGPLTGEGQSVGLMEYDGYNLSDVTGTFDGESYSVPINNVLIDGGSAASDGDDAEQVLDIVQAISMAPRLSQVRVYIAPLTYTGPSDADEFNKMATENICKQISVSWVWSPDDPALDDPIFEEFAAQGQTVFAASGDWDAYPEVYPDQYYPAEDAYVTAVGGTHLNTNGAGGPWQSEVAWPESGGGPSPDGVPIPSWQTGLANSSNGGSSTYRNVPDVAAEADFDNYVCDQGYCEGGWAGTSFASPRWAGFLALINQQAADNGSVGVGFINPAIYPIAEGSGYDSDFHDVTSGNNNNGNGQSYNAVTGYDLVTGWGSPNGQNLIDAVAGFTFPVTVGTSPAGLSFSVDGTTYSSAQTFTWTIGSSHTIATANLQDLGSDSLFAFTSWSDGGTSSHSVTASAGTASYTALFSRHYPVLRIPH